MLVRYFSIMIRLIVTCKLLPSKRKSSTCLTGKRACFLMNSCWMFYVPCSPLIFQSRAPPPSGHTAGRLALFLLLCAAGLGNTGWLHHPNVKTSNVVLSSGCTYPVLTVKVHNNLQIFLQIFRLHWQNHIHFAKRRTGCNDERIASLIELHHRMTLSL